MTKSASNFSIFFSYVRRNDSRDRGQITKLRQELEWEIYTLTGEDCNIFQDIDDIEWGQPWRERISQALDEASLLIAVITPSFLKSEPCRFEVDYFLDKEKKLGKSNMILPLLYIETPELKNKDDRIAVAISAHQWVDCTNLRFLSLDSSKWKKQIEALAKQIIRNRDQNFHNPRHAQSVINIPNSLLVKENKTINQVALEVSLPPIAPPRIISTRSDEGRAPQIITLQLRPSGEAERDRRRIKHLYGILISYPGNDRFSFQIFEGDKGHLLDFPNESTRICPEMLDRLKKLLGEEAWHIEPITSH